MKKQLHLSLIALSATLLLTSFTQPSFAKTVSKVAPSQLSTTQQGQQTKININHSTINELQTLKGVGHKKAQSIVHYREKVGKFTHIDELAKVKGIGEKIISDNVSRLTI